ncbi:MAG: hypothetical protein ACKO3W_10055, partial [bacterium]
TDPYAPYPAADASSELALRQSRWRVIFPAISIVIGMLGMCVQAAFAVQVTFWDAIMSLSGITLTPPPDIIRWTTTAQVALIVPLGILLVAGSAMLFLRKPLGARLVMVWAVGRLLLVIAGFVAAAVTIKPQAEWGLTLAAEMRDEMRKQGLKEEQLPKLPDAEQAQADGIRNIAIVSVATATWPFVMAIVLTRRHVRAEIASWKVPAPPL